MPGPGKGRQRRSASGLTGRATAGRESLGTHRTVCGIRGRNKQLR
jgi:hypothetical protein